MATPPMAPPLSNTNVYILKLEDNCWYIGRTADVKRRVESHFKYYGSAWTKLHKPIALETTHPNASPFDEDRYVKEYMFKYGIDRVRGGTYSQPILSNVYKCVLQREIWGAQDLCFLCGRDHFVKNCFAKKDVFGNPIAHQNCEPHRKSGNCLRKSCVTIYTAVRDFIFTIPPRK